MNYQKILKQAELDGIEKCAVGGVLIYNNQVLLLKRAAKDYLGGLVELPGGGIEAGETLRAALVREIAEETNLTVKASAIQTYIGYFDYETATGKRARQFNFLVPITDIVPLKISAEHEAFHWVDMREIEASQLPISDKTRTILKRAEQIVFPVKDAD